MATSQTTQPETNGARAQRSWWPWIVGGVVVLLVVGMASGSCGGGAERAATVSPRRAALRETIVEPARTRLESRRPIVMAVTARVERITLEPGDVVKKGDELIVVDRVPLERAVGEHRGVVQELRGRVELERDTGIEEATLASAEAREDAATAARDAARLMVNEERDRADRFAKDYERQKQLVDQGAVARTTLDEAAMMATTSASALARAEIELSRAEKDIASARADANVARETLRRKKLQTEVVASQLLQAEERLARAEHDLELSYVRAPFDGIILQRFELGGGPIVAGTPLFTMGDLNDIDVEADLLTQDAVALRPGALVEYTMAPGLPPLTGKVTRVDPAGFTKLSSLGVEQQRVFVVSSLDARPDVLGMGFRLQARYTKGEKADALILPRAAILQAPDESFYVFKVVGGRLQRTTIKIGLRNDFDVEVVEGVGANDSVVAAPTTAMKDGQRL